MKNTWASGAVELLQHADSHIELDTAFDKRIAFISIDNSVETSIRVFLSMPQSKSKIKISWNELKNAEHSFPKHLALLFKYAGNRLVGIDDGDIEHYHRIRNTLYHNGTGLSVDQQYLRAYRRIAEILLQNLFNVFVDSTPKPEATLELLIFNWNIIDRIVRSRFDDAGIDYDHTFKWEQAVQDDILSPDQVTRLTELRLVRNNLVHSTTIDRQNIEHWVWKSKELLEELST